MSEYSDENDNKQTEEVHLQADIYGIKFKTAIEKASLKGEPLEDFPKTWREVIQNIHRSLKTITSGAFGLVGDVVTSSRKLVRGIGEIPGAIATRVKNAQAKGDREEAEAAERQEVKPIEVSVASLEEWLSLQAANGISVQAVKRPSGEYAIVVVRPELAEAAMEQAIKMKLAEAPNKPLVKPMGFVTAEVVPFPVEGLSKGTVGFVNVETANVPPTGFVPPSKADTPKE